MASRSSTWPLDLAIGITFLCLVGGIIILVQRSGDAGQDAAIEVAAIAPEPTVTTYDKSEADEVQQTDPLPSSQGSEQQTPLAPLQEFPSDEGLQEMPGNRAPASEISVDEAWDRAVENPSIAAFRGFLEDFPKTNYTMRAKLKINQLNAQLDQLALQCLQEGNKASCALYLNSTVNGGVKLVH